MNVAMLNNTAEFYKKSEQFDKIYELALQNGISLREVSLFIQGSRQKFIDDYSEKEENALPKDDQPIFPLSVDDGIEEKMPWSTNTEEAGVSEPLEATENIEEERNDLKSNISDKTDILETKSVVETKSSEKSTLNSDGKKMFYTLDDFSVNVPVDKAVAILEKEAEIARSMGDQDSVFVISELIKKLANDQLLTNCVVLPEKRYYPELSTEKRDKKVDPRLSCFSFFANEAVHNSANGATVVGKFGVSFPKESSIPYAIEYYKRNMAAEIELEEKEREAKKQEKERKKKEGVKTRKTKGNVKKEEVSILDFMKSDVQKDLESKQEEKITDTSQSVDVESVIIPDAEKKEEISSPENNEPVDITGLGMVQLSFFDL